MAAFTTNDPRGMSVVSWTDATVLQLLQYGTPGRLENPDDWKTWGCTALAMLSNHGITTPDPNGFSEWSAWAAEFNQCLDAVQ